MEIVAIILSSFALLFMGWFAYESSVLVSEKKRRDR